MDETMHQPQDLISRRSMMFKGAAMGVGATAVGRLLVDPPDVFAKKGHTKAKKGRLTKGDAASSDSWPPPRSSSPISGSSTTSSPASRTARCRAAAGTPPIPRLSRCWTRT